MKIMNQIRKKILIIDDSSDSLALLQMLLEANGHFVYTAINGREAPNVACRTFGFAFTHFIGRENAYYERLSISLGAKEESSNLRYPCDCDDW